MLSIIIYCIITCKIMAMNENRRQNDKNEEYITTKRFEDTIIRSNFFCEANSKDFDEYLSYDSVQMCHSSCTSGLSEKHSLHREIDEEVVNHILQLSDCSFSDGLSTEISNHLNPDPQKNIPFLDFNFEPSITTVYPEYDSIAKHIVHQNIEDLDFMECNPLLNLKFNKLETFSDEETLSMFTSDSESSLSELNIDSIINNLSMEKNTADETLNHVALNSKFFRPFEGNITSSLISSHRIEEIHKKVKEHIALILTKSKSYIKWYTERLDGIYYLIKELQSFKHSNYEKFLDQLDVRIFKLLDAISMRKHSKINDYGLNEFAVFNCFLMNYISDLNLYDFISRFNLVFKKVILSILCVEYVKLFKFFPIFPELITLGSLFNQERDEIMFLYVRIIYLICEENKSRLRMIRTYILFFMKKLFLTPRRRTREIDIISEVKFNISAYFQVKSICNNDHSNLNFFTWAIHSDKVRRIKEQRKDNGGYSYDITIYSIEHFRAVFDIFLFQHIIFLEHYNISYEQYEALLKSSTLQENCVFCLFLNYLESVKAEVLRK
ncbi:hypothetical protein NBO_24g0021 [Nosema bombycis CQ1]|uniref:Uncharacterized protein n=1 Tax=Nosema bombycis (strain CQ1 / CVCC 102059) TaxID=578461 RepID=R0KUN8_NOSB1|nr:hypothetical protein NBO_24g0021 [Nosema bombycis CQ1]|eukprot:EOB14576.1 hypothetical protein NBO_24g0021 [Nosema bombycis CQ1]